MKAAASRAALERYLDSLSNHGIRPGLERMNLLMRRLGHPESRFRSVHVTGTNGKGSVCAMLERILRESRYKTGLYTSPHLMDVRERIRVSGDMISREDFYRQIGAVRAALRGIGLERAVTYFEITTAAAFLHFAQKGVDIAVVEVGLGGRWDATNVLPRPELCIVTNVALDHMEFLGGTVRKIAAEKAGILKPGCPAITGAEGAALRIIRSRAHAIGAPCLISAQSRINKEFMDEALKSMALQGDFQRMNLRLVLEAAHQLRKEGWKISPNSLMGGLKKTQWPARFDIRRWGKKPIVIDGAHNPAAMKALMETVRLSGLSRRPCLLVFNALKDKGFRPMARSLRRGLAIAKVLSPRLPTSRSLDPRSLQPEFGTIPFQAERSISVLSRNLASLSTRRKNDFRWILATGSLYLAGGLLAACKNRLPKISFEEAFS